LIRNLQALAEFERGASGIKAETGRDFRHQCLSAKPAYHPPQALPPEIPADVHQFNCVKRLDSPSVFRFTLKMFHA
jgi:hypothetical protein